MLPRLFVLTYLFPLTLFCASCVEAGRTENRGSVVHLRGAKAPFEGCIVRAYPGGRKKSELYYRKGKPTGEGTRWYENGQKESETRYRSGKIHSRKLWNTQGYLYAFEQYRDGKLLQPLEMDYEAAAKACRKAAFDGHRDWKLPSVRELRRLPFSEATKEMTFVASDPPKKRRSEMEVSYVRFGSTPATPRWASDDLPVNTTFNVICVRAKNPRVFRLVMGVNGVADLAFSAPQSRAAEPAPRPVPVAKKVPPRQESVSVAVRKEAIEKGLRPGYYIAVYTFEQSPPEKKLLDNILRSGYRYKFSKLVKNGKTLTRVLVGPFPDKKKAATELKRVHGKIEPDAFIIDNRY